MSWLCVLSRDELIAQLVAGERRCERLLELEDDPVGSSPEDLAGFLRSEPAKWAKVIKSVGVKAD